MPLEELEERLIRLKKEVEALKHQCGDTASNRQPWWEQISCVFKDCPEFDEAARLGREWRESQRLDYCDDDTIIAKAENDTA